MRKIFGIMLALALVLGMTVMASPVSATITPGWVSLSDDVAGATATYTIRFYTEEPLVAAYNDVINVNFPLGTDVSTVVVGDITVNAAAAAVLTTVGQTLVIEVAADVAAGTVTVVIDNVDNPAPCYHYLSVGTSHETTVDVGPYKIYLLKMDLVAGWNLISLPGIPEDTALEAVLADLLNPLLVPATYYFEVYYYETATATWFIYASDTSFSSLTTMEDGKAYWIWSSHAETFRVKGVWYPLPPGPPLKYCYVTCWNMVGFTSGSDMLGDLYLLAASPEPLYIYTYRAGAWVTIDPSSDDLIVGEGYWMSFVDPACVVPPTP